MSTKQKKLAMNQKSIYGVSRLKSKNMWTTGKRLMGVIKKSNLLILLAIVITIIGTVMQVYTPKRLGAAITLVFDGFRGSTAIDFDAVLVILLTVFTMIVGVFITTFLQQRLMVVVAQKATYTLRNEFKAKMNKVPVSYFDKNANGTLM